MDSTLSFQAHFKSINTFFFTIQTTSPDISSQSCSDVLFRGPSKEQGPEEAPICAKLSCRGSHTHLHITTTFIQLHWLPINPSMPLSPTTSSTPPPHPRSCGPQSLASSPTPTPLAANFWRQSPSVLQSPPCETLSLLQSAPSTAS